MDSDNWPYSDNDHAGNEDDDDDVRIGVTCPVHGEECPHSGCSHCLGGPSVLSLLLQGIGTFHN